MSGSTIEIESITKQEVEITPKFVAELFMNMDSIQQAEFFTHCDRIYQGWRQASKQDPGMQWYYMRSSLKDTKWDEISGWNFILDLAAPFYVHFDPGFLGR